MKSLQKLATAQKGKYYLLLFFAFLLGSVILAQAYLIVSIVDGLFMDKQTFDQVFPLLLVLLGVLLLRSFISYWTSQMGVKMAAHVKQFYRKKLIHAFSRQSLTSSYEGQSGQKVSVLLDAVDEIDSFFSKYIPQKMMTTIVPIMILIVVFSQHVYSGLIIVLTAPFIPIFMMIIGKSTQRKSEEQLERLAAFSGRFLDTLQGLVSLKLYGRSKQYRSVIKQSSLDFRDATMGILKVAFMSSLMLEFISMLSIGLVALELGLRLVVFNEISFFTAFFILLLIPEFYASLKELGSAFHAGRSSMGAAAKIEQELVLNERMVEWGDQELPAKPKSITLKDVQYQYGEDGFTLKNLNVQIPSTGQVAIVGKSGSGKTTLLHVLAGLLPVQAGKVLIDGWDRSIYKEEDWFKQISYITQHPFLFSGTIAENIAFGVEATMDEVKMAGKKAGIDDLIQSLNNGYDTAIGEGGRGLSGGEKQRIALARAFLKKPSIILFDEPTTGLDLFTEQILQRSIEQLAETSMVITVAHRLQTIQQAKQIVFMEKGSLLFQGTHKELKASHSRYRELFSLQEGRND